MIVTRLTPLIVLPFLYSSVVASDIGLPSLGVVYDKELSGIRRIIGMKGAAVLSAPVEPGFQMTTVAIAPGQQHLLARADDGDELRLVRIGRQTIDTSVLPDAIKSDSMVFSPAGMAAVLYNSNDGQLQVVSGLPDSPAVGSRIEIGFIPHVKKLSVTDDAEIVVLLADDAVWLLQTTTGKSAIVLQNQPTAASFVPGTHDVVVISQSGDVFRVSLVSDAIQIAHIEHPDVALIFELRTSANGKQVYAVSSSGFFFAIDDTGVTHVAQCGCGPSELSSVMQGKSFRLTNTANAPVFVADVSGAEPSIWFIPAATTELSGGLNE